MEIKTLRGVEILWPVTAEYSRILTKDALDFLAELARFSAISRDELFNKRRMRQKEIDSGKMPDFPDYTEDVRKNTWTVDPVPQDLQKRWVEITGPASDRKMFINAMNSGADVYMTDFEDSLSPTWKNVIEGQINIRDAIDGIISFHDEKKNKLYKLGEKRPTLIVRPRGLHLDEKHVLIDGKPVSASVFDFALSIYHHARNLIGRGSGPYFYLPKMENHYEARWWNDLFVKAEYTLGIPAGSIKATVLIENILAAFEADEILWELKHHSAGLNVGRWDYIASFAKKFRNRREFIFPDRGFITMNSHFLKSYVDYVIQVCHKRGIHAIGGMAAQIPINNDPEANAKALAKVKADKEREVKAGHDGTWVAYPALVPIAREVFEKYLGAKPHQIDVKREDFSVTADDLLAVPAGPITEEGLRENINAYIKYVAGWLCGTGAVAIAYETMAGKLYAYLMEDAATAEISRTLVWKWIEEGTTLFDGRQITVSLVQKLAVEEMAKVRSTLGDEKYYAGHYHLALGLFIGLMKNKKFPEYLTLPAYDVLLKLEKRK